MNNNKQQTLCRLSAAVISACFGMLVLLTPTAFAQQYWFGRAEFPIGPMYPYYDNLNTLVATADFNGDGLLDLAVGTLGEVSVLLGKPDGTFQAPVSYSIQAGVLSVAIADFNLDGKLDLAALDGYGTVYILLGKGDGTFESPVAAFFEGAVPVLLTVGDFNKDGKPDLAILGQGCVPPLQCGGTVTVLLGKGDGSFGEASSNGTAPGLIATSLAIGDFNNDGKPDMVVVNANTTPGANSSAFSILLGNGDGTFQKDTDYAVPELCLSSVTVADFNKDGNLDLALAVGFSYPCQAAGNANKVAILLGLGNGVFQSPIEYRTGLYPSSVIARDFNGDGKLDLASANTGDQTVSILLGKGDGTFQTDVDYPAGIIEGSFAAGDFNGDGILDLALSSNVGVSILPGNGKGTFPPRMDYLTGPSRAVAVGDFNSDGYQDVAVASGADSANDNVSVLLNKGDGTFQTHRVYTGSSPTWLTVGDFNKDGKPDLAVTNNINNVVSISLGNGDGTFQAHIDHPTGNDPLSGAQGDFNEDGNLDVVVANWASNTVSILLGRGDGTFQAHVDYAAGMGPYSVAVGDFNGDGKPDLAVADSTSNSVAILLGKGDGKFQAHVDYATGKFPISVTTGDFNGDGRLDLAVANFADGTISVLLGKGDGTFDSHIDYPAAFGESPTSVVPADLNHAGRLDLVVAVGIGVSLLFGNGDGTFQQPFVFSTSHQDTPISAAVGDFINSYRASDLVLANGASESVTILLNTPVIALFPSDVCFAERAVGTTSGPRTVMLSNPSPARLSISSISITGADARDFHQTNTCGKGIAPGSHCTVTFKFAPKKAGVRTAVLSISDNALARRQVVTLRGVATALEPSRSASSIRTGQYSLVFSQRSH
jgi:FG-GAP-like repeat/Abnormal spindle-like microcephaly-assoc'd, ASPM-SPD-2-Hydin